MVPPDFNSVMLQVEKSFPQAQYEIPFLVSFLMMSREPRINSPMKKTSTTEDETKISKLKKGKLGDEKNFKNISSCYQKEKETISHL